MVLPHSNQAFSKNNLFFAGSAADSTALQQNRATLKDVNTEPMSAPAMQKEATQVQSLHH